MGILDYLKKNKSTMTPMDILRERAQNSSRKAECDCVMCKNNDDIENFRLIYVNIEGPNEENEENVVINQSPAYKIPKGVNLEDVAKVLSYINETIEGNYEIDYDTLDCQKMVQKCMPRYGFEFDEEKNKEIINKRVEESLLTLKKSNVYNQTEYMSKKTDDTLVFDLNTPEKTLNFFTVSNNWNAFKHSSMYKDYFNWFTPFVSTSEVEEIYQKCNMNLPKAPVPEVKEL